MRVGWSVFAVTSVLLCSSIVSAQPDSTARIAIRWIPIGVVGAAVVLDPEAREWALRERSPFLNHLAHTVNPLGTAHVLVPAMAITYVAARLTGRDGLSSAALTTAAGYVAADVVESLLKPALGRERPLLSGNARRFHPFTGKGDWHSLPSAHVVHIAAIAAAVSAQSRSRVVAVAGDVLVGLVSWDRVYEDQHWASDVAASAVLGTIVSRAAVRWVEVHWPHRR